MMKLIHIAAYYGVFSFFLSGTSSALVLADGGKSDYQIVRPAEPTPLEARAAAELQSFLAQVTGAQLPVVSDAEPVGEREVVLGACNRLNSLGVDLVHEDLGDEGFIIRTVGTSLVIAGGRLRGTLYGVYALLEEQLGCRWFAPGVSRIPEIPHVEISAIDERQIPAFGFRQVVYPSSQDADWVMRNRLNGDFLPATSEFAGQRRIEMAGIAFWQLIPPDTYFKAHPEWFSLVDGQRTLVGRFTRTQLCLTNEEMIAEAVTNARKWARENPRATIFGIYQNDGPGGWCECEHCAAVEASQGGAHSAPVVLFVNRIASAIREDRPDSQIITLAYSYTRPAPTSIKPDPHVTMWITTGACGSHNIGDVRCAENAPVRGAVRDWSYLTNNIFVWDYVVNFRQFLMPFPNLHTLAPNLQYFAGNGVKGVFEQGSGPARSDMDALRCYVLAKLLWNPKYDRQTAIAEFLDTYYGPAAKPIHAYLNMLEEQVSGTDFHGLHMAPFDERTGPKYLSPEVMARAAQYFDEAESLVKDDHELLLRVMTARLSVDYITLRAAATVFAAAPKTQEGTMTAWFQNAMDIFFERAKQTGVQYVKESSRANSSMDDFRRVLVSGIDAWTTSPKASQLRPIANN